MVWAKSCDKERTVDRILWLNCFWLFLKLDKSLPKILISRGVIAESRTQHIVDVTVCPLNRALTMTMAGLPGTITNPSDNDFDLFTIWDVNIMSLSDCRITRAPKVINISSNWKHNISLFYSNWTENEEFDQNIFRQCYQSGELIFTEKAVHYFPFDSRPWLKKYNDNVRIIVILFIQFVSHLMPLNMSW